MINQTTPATALTLHPVLCLLKPLAHVCTLKMAEEGLGTYSASSQGVSWTV
jgi:hypothetical protein